MFVWFLFYWLVLLNFLTCIVEVIYCYCTQCALYLNYVVGGQKLLYLMHFLLLSVVIIYESINKNFLEIKLKLKYFSIKISWRWSMVSVLLLFLFLSVDAIFYEKKYAGDYVGILDVADLSQMVKMNILRDKLHR